MTTDLVVDRQLLGPAFPVWILVSPSMVWDTVHVFHHVGGARLGVAHVSRECAGWKGDRRDQARGRVLIETTSDNPVIRFCGFCRDCTHTALPRSWKRSCGLGGGDLVSQ